MLKGKIEFENNNMQIKHWSCLALQKVFCNWYLYIN